MNRQMVLAANLEQSTRNLALAAILLFLAGCAGTSGPGTAGPTATTNTGAAALPANYGRYSINQDRAPSQALDPAQIRDVVLQPITRGMAGNRSPYTVNGKSYRVMATEQGYREIGLASWYGEKFHGHKTSNGEVFDMYQLSAAHKSLPIPSYLRVTNLDNNRSIIVRVNDRGPFHSDRIVDLSYAAAWKLGFSDRGTARVQLESIIPGLDSPVAPAVRLASAGAGETDGSARYLQVGAFSDLGAAQRVSEQVQRMTSKPVFIRSVPAADSSQVLHRVRVGPLADPAEIEMISGLVVDADLGRPYTVVD